MKKTIINFKDSCRTCGATGCIIVNPFPPIISHREHIKRKVKESGIFVCFASSRPEDPVMHCQPESFTDVNKLAQNIIENGIYFFTTEFTTPDPLLTVFQPPADALNLLVMDARSKSGDKIAQSKIVYENLQSLLLYAKKTCKHNHDLIVKSGFPSNFQPQKLPPPGTPEVGGVVKDKLADFYKVTLKRKPGKKGVNDDPATHLKGVLYTVKLGSDPIDTSNYVPVLEGVPRTKLKIPVSKIIPNKRNFIIVYGVNSAGKGNACDPYGFSPEIS